MKSSLSSNNPHVMNAPWLQAAEHISEEQQPTRKRHRVGRILKRCLLFILAIILIVGGFLGYKVYENAAKLAHTNNPFSLFSTFAPASLATTNGHVNILLTGYSADDPGHQGAQLTDSIMILSVNPTTKKAVIISVPRDLYVHIPGFGYQKINAAYEDGESSHYPTDGFSSSGISLLAHVITQDFGVQFNYDALIDYTAFRDAVNAVDGITITLNSPDPRGLFDPYTNLHLPNGTVHLDGQQALNLARARGDGPGSYGFPLADFNRTQHQQQMLVALKDKASSFSVVSNPLKIAQLADTVGKNVQTNLTIGDMESLYLDTRGLSNQHIQTVTLNAYRGTDLLTNYVTHSGEDALVPAAGPTDFSQIQSAVQQIIGN